MPTAETFYEPGSSTTRGAGAGAVAGGGGLDIGGLFGPMLLRRLAMQDDDQRMKRAALGSNMASDYAGRQRANAGAANALYQPINGGMGIPRIGGEPDVASTDPMTAAVNRARGEGEIEQLNAARNPAPMRMVTGAGVIPGYTMDTNAMNAYQRKAYLPSSSQFGYSGPGPTSPSEDLDVFDEGNYRQAVRLNALARMSNPAPETVRGGVVPQQKKRKDDQQQEQAQ